jgi:hypothetical protein
MRVVTTTKGLQKNSRNANRMGGTSTRPDGRVDAYLTIDTPMGLRVLPHAGSSRMPERTGSRLRREMSGRIGSSMGKR